MNEVQKWGEAYAVGAHAYETNPTAKAEIDALNVYIYKYLTKPSRIWYKPWTWWPHVLSFHEWRLVLLWRGNPTKVTPIELNHPATWYRIFR